MSASRRRERELDRLDDLSGPTRIVLPPPDPKLQRLLARCAERVHWAPDGQAAVLATVQRTGRASPAQMAVLKTIAERKGPVAYAGRRRRREHHL